jgi:DNA-binding transcriptional regulator YiaG
VKPAAMHPGIARISETNGDAAKHRWCDRLPALHPQAGHFQPVPQVLEPHQQRLGNCPGGKQPTLLLGGLEIDVAVPHGQSLQQTQHETQHIGVLELLRIKRLPLCSTSRARVCCISRPRQCELCGMKAKTTLIDEVRTSRQMPSPETARVIRVAAGVSQARMARELRVDRATLNRWEAALARPRAAARARWAAFACAAAQPAVLERHRGSGPSGG